MVHSFRMFNNNIVFDTGGNSLHVFSDAAAALFGALPEDGGDYDAAKLRAIEREYGIVQTCEAMDDIKTLVSEGLLYAPSETDPGAEELAETYVLKSLCMHMAHDCNMKCAYCFASEGSFGQKRELMGYETARASIDFIASASAGRRNIEIDFFGGEPLLNFGVIKRTVEYARSIERAANKNFRFTLTTNGLLLNNAIARYINANMDNLVLSIDGRKEINDEMRTFPDGAGTYEHIVKNIKAVTEQRKADWYVRGTYTAKNKDFANDALHLADLGFTRMSLEPVVSPPDPELEFLPGDEAEICAEYEKLALMLYERECQGKPIDFFHFNIDLDEGPCLARRIKGCGAGYEYAAVAPDGSIYPCHQFAGNEKFKLGDVYGGIRETETVDLFKKSTVYIKDECINCWAKFFCGGGCAANAWQYNKDINKPNAFYCKLFRKRIECALWLKCAPYI